MAEAEADSLEWVMVEADSVVAAVSVVVDSAVAVGSDNAHLLRNTVVGLRKDFAHKAGHVVDLLAKADLLARADLHKACVGHLKGSLRADHKDYLLAYPKDGHHRVFHLLSRATSSSRSQFRSPSD